MTQTLQKPAQDVFQGLVLDDGRTFANWGLSRSTRPAVYAEPVSYADVQAAVRDQTRFPSPNCNGEGTPSQRANHRFGRDASRPGLPDGGSSSRRMPRP